MGSRKVIVKQTAAESISAIAWYIESQGLIVTAERFVDAVYDYLLTLSDSRKSYALCREPKRAVSGYKCITYKKRYTIVFIESETELIICEFISSKKIYW
jgi:hypothetical protein